MKHSWFFLMSIAALMLLLAGCKSSRDRMEEQITALETRLFDTEKGFSQTGADSLVAHYTTFAEAYPADSLAPLYLFKAATLEMNMNNGPNALALFQKIRETYSDHQNAPLCLFFMGYVQENIFGDIDKAREMYQQFIDTYPAHDFADDAQASIHNLGKTPEEMIREFEAMQQASGAGNDTALISQ